MRCSRSAFIGRSLLSRERTDEKASTVGRAEQRKVGFGREALEVRQDRGWAWGGRRAGGILAGVLRVGRGKVVNIFPAGLGMDFYLGADSLLVVRVRWVVAREVRVENVGHGIAK